MAKRFVFLEITDPEIITLISGIREIAMGAQPRGNVHITIRGPYDREIPPSQLERYQRTLRSDPILLQGVDSFQDEGRQVVYMKVNHPKLRRMWWKPDFPVRTFGFNPHITLYEGTDAARAQGLIAFLVQEKLKLVTWDFAVTLHVTDHKDLFGTKRQGDALFLKLVNRGLVRPDILARLSRALDPHQAIRVAGTG
jgi:2'-5' RNA ligase